MSVSYLLFPLAVSSGIFDGESPREGGDEGPRIPEEDLKQIKLVKRQRKGRTREKTYVRTTYVRDGKKRHLIYRILKNLRCFTGKYPYVKQICLKIRRKNTSV